LTKAEKYFWWENKSKSIYTSELRYLRSNRNYTWQM